MWGAGPLPWYLCARPVASASKGTRLVPSALVGTLLLTLSDPQLSSEHVPGIGTVAKNSVTAAGQFHLVAAR